MLYLGILKSIKNNVSQRDEIILRNFPSFDNGKTKNYFRKFVPFVLSIIDEKYLKESLEIISEIYKSFITNLGSLDVIFSTDVRKPIYTRFGKESPQHILSKQLVALSYSDKGKLISLSKESLVKKHENIITFDHFQVQEIIKNLIISDDNIDVIISLLLSSGCRPIELLQKSGFKKSTLIDSWILQDGIAKKRNKDEFQINKPLLYLDVTTFIRKLGIIRKKIAEKQIIRNSTLISKISNRVRQVFLREDYTTYTLRKIYGKLSYYLHKNNSPFGENPSYNKWLSMVLGHNIDDVKTSVHYSNISE